MTANELRIGNLIQDNNKEWIVSAQLIYSVVEGNGYLAGFKPIPLTEEWLVKFGFKVEHLNFGAYETKLNDFFNLQFELKNQWNEKDGFHLYVNGGEYDSNVFIKYVHQLQNLYFALTGEELTIL